MTRCSCSSSALDGSVRRGSASYDGLLWIEAAEGDGLERSVLQKIRK